MKLFQAASSVFVPDGSPQSEALSRITHLGVGAHQDDLEFMAYHGILECFGDDRRWFGGVVATNGGGSPRTGKFASHTDEEMMAVREQEQVEAARIGNYGVMIQTQHPSSLIKERGNPTLQNDLVEILKATRPSFVYTHNPADKHATHVAVAITLIRAIRSLPIAERPDVLWGAEVWRGLDWLLDNDKVALDVSARPDLAKRLSSVFVSQISGGKQYDQAVLGRRRANATFFESHSTDTAVSLEYAMDLSPLIRDDSLDIAAYVDNYIQKFAKDVESNIRAY